MDQLPLKMAGIHCPSHHCGTLTIIPTSPTTTTTKTNTRLTTATATDNDISVITDDEQRQTGRTNGVVAFGAYGNRRIFLPPNHSAIGRHAVGDYSPLPPLPKSEPRPFGSSTGSRCLLSTCHPGDGISHLVESLKNLEHANESGSRTVSHRAPRNHTNVVNLYLKHLRCNNIPSLKSGIDCRQYVTSALRSLISKVSPVLRTRKLSWVRPRSLNDGCDVSWLGLTYAHFNSNFNNSNGEDDTGKSCSDGEPCSIPIFRYNIRKASSLGNLCSGRREIANGRIRYVSSPFIDSALIPRIPTKPNQIDVILPQSSLPTISPNYEISPTSLTFAPNNSLVKGVHDHLQRDKYLESKSLPSQYSPKSLQRELSSDEDLDYFETPLSSLEPLSLYQSNYIVQENLDGVHSPPIDKSSKRLRKSISFRHKRPLSHLKNSPHFTSQDASNSKSSVALFHSTHDESLDGLRVNKDKYVKRGQIKRSRIGLASKPKLLNIVEAVKISSSLGTDSQKKGTIPSLRNSPSRGSKGRNSYSNSSLSLYPTSSTSATKTLPLQYSGSNIDFLRDVASESIKLLGGRQYRQLRKVEGLVPQPQIKSAGPGSKESHRPGKVSKGKEVILSDLGSSNKAQHFTFKDIPGPRAKVGPDLSIPSSPNRRSEDSDYISNSTPFSKQDFRIITQKIIVPKSLGLPSQRSLPHPIAPLSTIPPFGRQSNKVGQDLDIDSYQAIKLPKNLKSKFLTTKKDLYAMKHKGDNKVVHTTKADWTNFFGFIKRPKSPVQSSQFSNDSESLSPYPSSAVSNEDKGMDTLLVPLLKSSTRKSELPAPEVVTYLRTPTFPLSNKDYSLERYGERVSYSSFDRRKTSESKGLGMARQDIGDVSWYLGTGGDGRYSAFPTSHDDIEYIENDYVPTLGRDMEVIGGTKEITDYHHITSKLSRHFHPIQPTNYATSTQSPFRFTQTTISSRNKPGRFDGKGAVALSPSRILNQTVGRRGMEVGHNLVDDGTRYKKYSSRSQEEHYGVDEQNLNHLQRLYLSATPRHKSYPNTDLSYSKTAHHHPIHFGFRESDTLLPSISILQNSGQAATTRRISPNKRNRFLSLGASYNDDQAILYNHSTYLNERYRLQSSLPPPLTPNDILSTFKSSPSPYSSILSLEPGSAAAFHPRGNMIPQTRVVGQHYADLSSRIDSGSTSPQSPHLYLEEYRRSMGNGRGQVADTYVYYNKYHTGDNERRLDEEGVNYEDDVERKVSGHSEGSVSYHKTPFGDSKVRLDTLASTPTPTTNAGSRLSLFHRLQRISTKLKRRTTPPPPPHKKQRSHSHDYTCLEEGLRGGDGIGRNGGISKSLLYPGMYDTPCKVGGNHVIKNGYDSNVFLASRGENNGSNTTESGGISLNKQENIGYRLVKRRELFEKRKRMSDWCLMIAMFGLVLMMLENEIVFRNPSIRVIKVNIMVQMLITLSTIALLGLIIGYYQTEIKLFRLENFVEDWRVAITYKNVIFLLMELGICMIHPLPKFWMLSHLGAVKRRQQHQNTYYYNDNSPKLTAPATRASSNGVGSSFDNGSKASLTLPQHSSLGVPVLPGEHPTMEFSQFEILLSVLMFARLYLVIRVLLLHSKMFTDTSSRSIGALNRIKFNTQFIFKTLMTMYPVTVMLSLMISWFLLASWILRTCERQHDPNNANIFNAFWLTCITFLAIGYGDLVPNTYCGRGISVCTGIMGAGCTALVVAVLAKKLELTRAEKHVHNFMMDTQYTKRLKNAAANVLRETWLIYKNTKLTQRLKPSRIRKHQRKFLAAIKDLRRVKTDQRKLLDNQTALVDIAKIQTSIHDIVIDSNTVQGDIKSKISDLHINVTDVKRSFDLMQKNMERLLIALEAKQVLPNGITFDQNLYPISVKSPSLPRTP